MGMTGRLLIGGISTLFEFYTTTKRVVLSIVLTAILSIPLIRFLNKETQFGITLAFGFPSPPLAVQALWLLGD